MASKSAPEVGRSFSDSACFLLKNHHRRSFSLEILVFKWYIWEWGGRRKGIREVKERCGKGKGRMDDENGKGVVDG